MRLHLPAEFHFVFRVEKNALGGLARACAALLLAALSLGGGAAYAASGNFNITSGTTTASQSLGANQTGNVSQGATLSVSGSTVAVTITGNNANLTNLGSILQTGSGRVVRDNTGVTGLVINNGSTTNSTALMRAADADVVQINVSNGSVILNNYGTMTSLNASAGGSQAVDFNAITTGANTINNFSTGIMQATEADAVRPGVNGVVNNAGIIRSTTTTGSSSDGVDAQNNSGISVVDASNWSAGTPLTPGSGLIEGARHGITGGQLNSSTAFTISVTNNLGGTIQGDNGSGINIDGLNALQTATIINSGSIIGNGITGDGDGVDVDGVVNLTNKGLIRSVNAVGSNSEGITVGGGTITNSGTIEGLLAAGNTAVTGRGITLSGNDITSGPLAGTREALYAAATVTNQAGGMIRGQSDSAIVVEGPASGFTVTINNNAGATLKGGGGTNAAVLTGADNDTINNAGTIDGSSSGKAVDMGAGNNTLNVTGGSASFLGSISGGVGGTNTMTLNPGTGNAFAYSGQISNFSKVEVVSGTVTLSGANTYAGETRVSGGMLVLDGTNRVSAASALTLNSGTLKLTNAGANGQTFASLALLANSIIDLDNSSSLTLLGLTGTFGGSTLSLLDYLSSASPDYAFRLLGDYSTNANFLALIGDTTINGLAASYRFDGTYTDVTPFAAAVPEPANFVMIGVGMMLLVGLRRKRLTPQA